jgi:hypothetical protein
MIPSMMTLVSLLARRIWALPSDRHAIKLLRIETWLPPGLIAGN